MADHEDTRGVDVRLRAQERHCGNRVIGGFIIDCVGAGKILWSRLAAFLVTQRSDVAIGQTFGEIAKHTRAAYGFVAIQGPGTVHHDDRRPASCRAARLG